MEVDIDVELEKVKKIYHELQNVDKSTRVRILTWLANRFDIDANYQSRSVESLHSPAIRIEKSPQITKWTQQDQVLSACFTLQKHEKNYDYTAKHINSHLKKLGVGISNLNRTINALQNSNPAFLVESTRRKSKMQHKRVRLTEFGLNYCEGLF